MKELRRWILETVQMKIAYLIAIYSIFLLPSPFIFKIIMAILLPIGFFFEAKQDYNRLKQHYPQLQ